MNVAIVGASGAVGQELLSLLQERHFPVTQLRLFGSARSAGTCYPFAGKMIKVEQLQHGDQFRDVDLAFVSAGGTVSREYSADITRYGTIMIDNSSAYRLDDNVPLVVPEINAQDLWMIRTTDSPRIIAVPNCTTIVNILCLAAIERLSHIQRVHVASYQSASGAGAEAMAELQEQYRQSLAGEKVSHHKFAYQLAYNVIPHIDVFGQDDYTKEELKLFYETRKILHSDVLVSGTCVRVPSLRAHSEAVWVETEQPIEVEKVKDAFSHTPGVTLMDNIELAGQPVEKGLPYPMPLYLSGTDNIYVGRVRRDLAYPNGITFWCVGDQIRKGASLNAIQIAEYLLLNGQWA